jgi:DNA-directed RNA polymerase subunit RPC12/RpoP
MPKVDRVRFKQDAVRGKGAKFSGWKDDGETTGWIHPKIGIWERWCHGAVPSVEEKDGKSEMRRRRCNCVGTTKGDIPNASCPMCQLQEFAISKLGEGCDGDEVILEAGSGKDRFVLDLNDLAGKGDYRTNPKVKSEVCFAWIAKPDDDDDGEKKVEIITGPHTLGERILEVIEEQVAARGEMVGDCEVPEGFKLKLKKGKLVLSDGEDEIPWQPYPFKLKYKPDSQPATMYSAMKIDADLCPITPAVADVMLSGEEELDLDMKKLCGAIEADKQLDILKSSWDSRTIPYEEFEDFFRERNPSKKTKKKAKDDDDDDPKSKKAKDDDEPKAKKAKNDDDDEAEEKPAKTHCPECGHKNKAGTKFCSQCGSKLSKPDETEEPEAKKKAKDDDDDELKKTKKAKDDDDEPKAKKKTKDDDEEPKAKKAKDDDDDSPPMKKIKCPECKATVTPMKKSGRCPECGEKLGEEDVPR